MKKLIGLIALFMFAAVMSYAVEVTSTEGTAKAKIIQAATLTHATGAALDFGTIIADTDGGTVTVTTDGTGSAQRNPQNIEVVSASGYTPDHFVLSNLDPDTTYTVSVDSSVTLSKAGADPMTATLSLPVTQVTDATQKDLYVGGMLTVGATQAAGEYEGHYTMTVTY